MTVNKKSTVQPEVAEKTKYFTKDAEANLIWEEIKDLPISMFGLPNQTVEQHCFFIPVEPSKLYLTIKSSSALPALETSLQAHSDRIEAALAKTGGVNHSKFSIEMAEKFVMVSRVNTNPFPILKK